MRGCLFQLILTFFVVFCLVWFALPIGVGYLATGALNATGFTGTNTAVDVSANPPPLLLTGHADTIHIQSTEAGIRDLHAATLDVTLGNVDLLSRQTRTVTGTLTGVRVAAPNGDQVTIQKVTLAGAATAATATCTMTQAEAVALAVSQLLAMNPPVVAKVSLKAPNVVTITVLGQQQSGRLVTTNGSLLLVTDLGGIAVTLIAPGPGNPFRFTSVNIGQGTVTFTGTISIQDLLS